LAPNVNVVVNNGVLDVAFYCINQFRAGGPTSFPLDTV
jgi:hypothetical protein